MQAEERVIIVDWSQYYVPGVVKVHDQAGEDHLLVDSDRIVPNSMVVIERVRHARLFTPILWQVKESETTGHGPVS